MTRDPLRPSDALLAEIARNLQPVKPGILPSRMALRVAPIALLASFAVLVLIGLRKDAGELGPFVAWGASIAQIALAVTLIWIAARESTPARRLPTNIVWSAAAATLLMVVAFGVWTFAMSPPVVMSRFLAWRVGLICGVGGTIAGALLVAVFGWLFGPSLAARPALAGALYGASAGITVNAGWRLACPNSSPWHTFTAHGAAIVSTTVLGAVAAHLIAKRARRMS